MNKTLNHTSTMRLFEKSADVLINENPKQGYDSTKFMETAALMTVEHYGLNQSHLYDLLVIRESFEKKMDKQYKIKRSQGMMSMTQDIGSLLKSKKVPQRLQVMSGFMDMIIGILYIGTEIA